METMSKGCDQMVDEGLFFIVVSLFARGLQMRDSKVHCWLRLSRGQNSRLRGVEGGGGEKA